MKDLVDANGSVRRPKSDPLHGFRIMPLETDESRVSSVNGWSFETDKVTGASQGDFSLAITTPALNNNHEKAPFSTISWVAYQIKRVVGITLAVNIFQYQRRLAEEKMAWALWQDCVWRSYDPTMAVIKSDSTNLIDLV